MKNFVEKERPDPCGPSSFVQVWEPAPQGSEKPDLRAFPLVSSGVAVFFFVRISLRPKMTKVGPSSSIFFSCAEFSGFLFIEISGKTSFFRVFSVAFSYHTLSSVDMGDELISN